MSHHGLLSPVYIFTPVRDETGKVTSITINCTMYSIPYNAAATSYYTDENDQQQTSTGCTDESNKVHLGSINITWPVPTAHQSTADPYKINWLYFLDRENNEKQMTLIKASTDYKNMMNNLSALQSEHDD